MNTSKRSRTIRWRPALALILTLYIIGELTLRPEHTPLIGPQASFWCLLGCGHEVLRDLLSNILLFVPLGWTLSYWLRPTRVLLIALLMTGSIEALQATVIVGRDSSLRDILSNVTGAWVGLWLFAHWLELRFPQHSKALKLGATAVVLWVAILIVSGWGTRGAPNHRPWFGEWTPEKAAYAPFTGQLLSVDLDGVTPENGPINQPGPLQASLGRDSFKLTARIVWGPPVTGTAAIFDLVDDRGAEQLWLGQFHRVLWFRVRREFDRWEMRALTLRLPRDPAWKVGDTITVTARLKDRVLSLRGSSSGHEYQVEVPQTVGLAWNAMAPWMQPNANQWYFNAAWMALLGVPLGYWLGRWSPVFGLLVAGVSATLALLLAPILGGAAPTQRHEWIGSACGIAIGWLDGIWSRVQARGIG